MVKKPKFYQMYVDDAERTADIFIYGDITQDAEFIDGILGVKTGLVSATGIVGDINNLDVDSINVYINSYGGEVAEALAIYTALQRHTATVHTFCDGFACSAATIIFCAGDVRTMGSIALMMIHNCSMYVGQANANQMRKAAEDADTINQMSIDAYLKVSNLSEDKIKEMMDAETWIPADKALEYGFATEIAEPDEDDEEPEQSAFMSIREAILEQQNNRLLMMDQKLDKILEALKKDPAPAPIPKGPEPTPNQKTSFYKRYINRRD